MSEPREQEQQIKDRKRLLFDDDPSESAPSGDRKPFALHLREVPAAPLSGLVKAALWGAGIVAALLLAAAIWKASQTRAKPDPEKAKQAAIAPGRPAIMQVAGRGR